MLLLFVTRLADIHHFAQRTPSAQEMTHLYNIGIDPVTDLLSYENEATERTIQYTPHGRKVNTNLVIFWKKKIYKRL